jgi:hypothetical protein
LGLERGDLETILLEQTAQAGDDDALAHERAGSLDHQRFGSHDSYGTQIAADKTTFVLYSVLKIF